MIDYSRPWQIIDVDTRDALNPNFDAEKFRAESEFADRPAGIWSVRGDQMLDFINADWLALLETRGIPVGSFLMFYRQPFLVYPEAHVDLFWHNSEPHIFALNWIFSPNDDSYMTWYDVANETGTISITSAETKYSYWKMEDVAHKEFARHTIGDKLTMVRTGIAHNIIVNEQPRWCMSLRFKSNQSIHDWQSAVDHFNNLGLVRRS